MYGGELEEGNRTKKEGDKVVIVGKCLQCGKKTAEWKNIGRKIHIKCQSGECDYDIEVGKVKPILDVLEDEKREKIQTS